MNITLDTNFLSPLLNAIEDHSGKAYLIGGAVIDTLHNRSIKDWDIEVFGIESSTLENILESLRLPTETVGKSFGVFKCCIDGIDLDINLPRLESKTGTFHTDFEITLDSNLTLKEAAKRRDLTINAISIDLHTLEVKDPYKGLSDLSEGLLCATNEETFIEDPLRVLRIMQLLPRKGKTVHLDTMSLCKSIHDQFQYLPAERVFDEFKKLLLKAPKPSTGLEFLRDCGWITHFPELNDLIGCEQNPEWHPEGDVWTHTLLVLDNAAILRDQLESDSDKLVYMFAALLHDVGKPSTTTEDLRSPGHAEAGVEIANCFLRRMTNETVLINKVLNLVQYHMQPGNLAYAGAKINSWRRLSVKSDLRFLALLSKADSAGRTGRSLEDDHLPSKLIADFLAMTPPIEPLIKGRDLLGRGLKAGPTFGPILKAAFELQLDNPDWTREMLLDEVL